PKESLTLLEGLPSILEGSEVPPAASLADDPEPPPPAVERDPAPDREIGKHGIHAEITVAEETGRVHSLVVGLDGIYREPRGNATNRRPLGVGRWGHRLVAAAGAAADSRRNVTSRGLTTSVRSMCGRCPARSIGSNRTRGIAFLTLSDRAIGTVWSSLPQRSRVGMPNVPTLA